ncbi:hypothetical protein L873DRAFT_1647814, partial [Choiromyces venosus 120613-1]
LENVWKVLKQRTKPRVVFPGTMESMTMAIKEEWDKLMPKDWNKYIDSMSYRLQQVRIGKG